MTRARTPVDGLRQRLRIALRAAGVDGKFKTDLLRDGSLIVRTPEALAAQPFDRFEDRRVIYTVRER